MRDDGRYDSSPEALAALHFTEPIEAFTPEPEILASTDVLFDAWSLTTVRDWMPGRPPVADWLHGVPTDWQPAHSYVGWREEVREITGNLLEACPPDDVLDDFPLSADGRACHPAASCCRQTPCGPDR